MTAVRATNEACAYVKKVFENRGLPFEERDVFIHKEHQKEMQNRLGKGVGLPQVIIDGIHIGVCLYLFYYRLNLCLSQLSSDKLKGFAKNNGVVRIILS
jgi:glutaredoxin